MMSIAVAIGQPQVTQSEDWYKNKRPLFQSWTRPRVFPLQHELMSERRVRIGLSIRIVVSQFEISSSDTRIFAALVRIPKIRTPRR